MSESTPTIQDLVASIPANPMDCWQVRVWLANEFKGDARTLTFRYYSDTSYEEIFPDNGKGAPVVDQWLIFDSDGRCLGRLTGWSSLAPWITERSEEIAPLNKYFPDSKNAQEYLKATLRNRVEKLEEEIEEVKAKLKRLGV